MTLALPDFVKENARWIAVGGAVLLAALAYFLFFSSNPADGQPGGRAKTGHHPRL